MAVSLPILKEKELDELVVEEEEDTEVCEDCGETPCVWQAKEKDMELFDQNEHGHIHIHDRPPNNIRRKKVYRQMFLYINQGPSGAGERMELPVCVETGTRKMFPSASFMGFKKS